MAIESILKTHGFELKKKTAKEYCCPCPMCGGTDRFCVWPDDNKAWCRQCDWKGDDIQLLRDLEGVSFKDAVEATGKGHKVKKLGKTTKTKGKEPFKHPNFRTPDLWRITN